MLNDSSRCKCKHSRTAWRHCLSRVAVQPNGQWRSDWKCHFKTVKPGTRQWSAQNCQSASKKGKNPPYYKLRITQYKREGCTDKWEGKSQPVSCESHSAEKGICTPNPSAWISITLVTRSEASSVWYLWKFPAGYQPVFLFLSSYSVRKTKCCTLFCPVCLKVCFKTYIPSSLAFGAQTHLLFDAFFCPYDVTAYTVRM